MKKIWISLVLFINWGTLFGQSNVALGTSFEIPMYSESIGDSLFIQIALPADYGTGEKEYPVIYLLDSDRSFGMVKGICWWLNFDKVIPNVIIVGLAYKKDWWQKRSRDYTPTKDHARNWGDWPIAGGSEQYLEFIERELNPILTEYRINWKEKTIIGHSFGGILATYSLFHKPTLFGNYISISPALIWDNHYLAKMNYKQLEDNTVELYVFTAIGELDSEKITSTWSDFNDLMESRNLENLKWEPRKYEDQTHSSVLPIAISDGLRKVFSEKE